MVIEHLIAWISQYGYAGLYGLLAISILGPPVPDEILMTFAGFLSHMGKLKPSLTIFFAGLGSITGITVTYWIGRLFHDRIWPRLERYAGASRVEKVLRWYHWNGGVLLTVGYFIPGVRHLTGYVAGMSGLGFRRFALFAYLGAFLWATTFISLGRVLGNSWDVVLPLAHEYTVRIGIGLGVLGGAFFLIFHYRRALGNMLRNFFKLWHREES